MFYALLCMVLIGMILEHFSKSTFRKLSYQRNFSKKTVEIGETSELVTIVENHSLLPVTFLQIHEQVPDEIEVKTNKGDFKVFDSLFETVTTFLLPRQKVTRKYTIACTKRGRIKLSDVALSTGDLFGLDTSSVKIELPQELVVLPGASDLESEMKPYGSYYGDISVKRWIIEDPVLTIGVRDYTGHEPLKSIHWPSSLKMNRLIVRNFDYTTDSRIIIILNIECSKPAYNGILEDKIEHCISIARAFIEQFELSCISYGIETNAYYSGEYDQKGMTEISHGKEHYDRLLEGLGRVSYNITETFEQLLENQSNNGSNVSYVLITPRILEPYVNALNQFQKNTPSTLLVTLDRENLDLLPNDMHKYVC